MCIPHEHRDLDLCKITVFLSNYFFQFVETRIHLMDDQTLQNFQLIKIFLLIT